VWASRNVVGSGWGAPVQLDADPASTDSVTLAGDRAGDVVATWYAEDAPYHDVYAARFHPGVGWDPAVAVDHDDVGAAENQAIAMAPDGSALLAWEQAGSGPRAIWSSRQPVGGSWSAPAPIVAGDPLAEIKVRVAIGGDGTAYATWFDTPPSGTWQVYAARALSGAGWDPATELDDRGEFEPSHIGVDARGDATLTWDQSTVTALAIDARRDVGGTWRDAQVISSGDTALAQSQQVATNPDGESIAVWVDRTDVDAAVLR
jgi:hypothetical protein